MFKPSHYSFWITFLGGLIVGGIGVNVLKIRHFPFTESSSHNAVGISKPERFRHDNNGSGRISGVGERHRSMIELARKLGTTDPTAGWSHGMSLKNLSDKADFMAAFMESWAIKDPEASLAKAGELGIGRLRNECIAAACGGWASRNPMASAKWVEDQLTGAAKSQANAAIASAWAEFAPEAATEWAGSLPSGTASESAISKALKTWVDRDPKAASDWASNQPEGSKRSTAMLQLAVEWSDQDPTGAAEWITRHVTSEDGSDMVNILLNRWSSADPTAAANWVGSLPEDQQPEAYAMILAVWTSDDPAGASAWVTSFPPGKTRQQAIPKLAESWAGINPQEAISWTLALAESSEKNKALDQSVRVWALNEYDTMSAWIESQPAGADSDHLRSVAAVVIAENHPLEGATLAAAIADPSVKQDAIVDILRQWQKKDSKAANAWIKQQVLDPKTLERLGQ